MFRIIGGYSCRRLQTSRFEPTSNICLHNAEFSNNNAALRVGCQDVREVGRREGDTVCHLIMQVERHRRTSRVCRCYCLSGAPSSYVPTIFVVDPRPTGVFDQSIRSVDCSLVVGSLSALGPFAASRSCLPSPHSADAISGSQETICVLVAHNVQKGEWACQVPFFPPHQTAKVSFCAHIM